MSASVPTPRAVAARNASSRNASRSCGKRDGKSYLFRYCAPELLMRTARESVPVMRAKWDESEGVARKAVLESGVKSNEADLAAFRAAAQPLLDEYHGKPELEALYRRIRDLA